MAGNVKIKRGCTVMGSRMPFLLLAVLLFTISAVVSLSVPRAHADKPLPVSIVDQPDTPLKILEAMSGYEDSGYTSNFYWRMQAKVRNVSDKRIVAFELEWVQYNAFDEKVDEINGVSNRPAPMEPGTETTSVGRKWPAGQAQG